MHIYRFFQKYKYLPFKLLMAFSFNLQSISLQNYKKSFYIQIEGEHFIVRWWCRALQRRAVKLENNQICQKFGGKKMKKCLVQLAFNPFLHGTMGTQNSGLEYPFPHKYWVLTFFIHPIHNMHNHPKSSDVNHQTQMRIISSFRA